MTAVRQIKTLVVDREVRNALRTYGNSQAEPVVQTWILNLILCDALSRRQLDFLSIIEQLTEAGVSLYILQNGLETLLPDGKPNPIANLCFGIIAEFNNLEKNLIRARMASGYEHHRASGGRVGRKEGYRKSEDEYRTTYDREITLLAKGNTLKDVRSITGTSINTLRKLKANYC